MFSCHVTIIKRIILFTLAGLAVTACQNHANSHKESIRLAKIVPEIYKSEQSVNLRFHGDTLYEGNSFYSGFLYSLNEAGDTIMVRGYFNGLPEGRQLNWHDNRQLAEERFYINGMKEGLQQGWWPDGKSKFHFNAKQDVYEGEFKEWYASGLLAKLFHYVNGQEEGSQRLWWDNGTVRANYIIRNGKKYGLIGMKICENPYDTIDKK